MSNPVIIIENVRKSFTLHLQTNADRANLSGVSNMDVAGASAAAMNGARLTVLREGDNQIPIVARMRADERASLSDVRNLYVYARSGAQTFAVKSEVVLSTLRGWKIELPDPGAAPGDGTNRPQKAGSIEVKIENDLSLLSLNRIGLMATTKFTLSAKDVSDPDGDPLTYIWDFGDGSATPPSAPLVEKIYREVNKFHVRLFVTDGKHANVLAGETDITIRDVTGTWLLTIRNDPNRPTKLPERMTVTLNQKGSLLDGRIVPENSNRPTILSGEVRHPATVYFGSESAWWNDGDDAYFELKVSDGFLAVQMTNTMTGRCGHSITCQSAFFQKQ